jgi:hypothetical protein
MKALALSLLASTAFSFPTFKMNPDEDQVLSIGCYEKNYEECIYDIYYVNEDDDVKILSNRRKQFPGIEKAPAFIIDTISSAASAMGDVTYIHVAVRHKNTMYEYMFDRSTGWNSFRAVPSDICSLKCFRKNDSKKNSDN